MASTTADFSLRSFLRHGLINLVFCCAVGAALTVTTNKPWDQQLVYSLAIGMPIWIVVDLGRFVVRERKDEFWPSGLRGVLLVVGAIAIAFVVGSAIGDRYCGCSTWGEKAWLNRQLVTSLVITLSAGTAGTYYFISAAQRKAQQTRIALAERDAMQARLGLLQAQLEPHMLFNTLANLRVLIALDPAQATRMLDHLVAYLRATLVASRATEHSLAQEFERLRDYLELMAMRMGPRLRYSLTLPEALADCTVPSLLLQPLVENSIRHGLEPQVAGGAVHVSAMSTPEGLRLQVHDSGIGLDTGKPKAGTGFGLVQVRERLATQFGTRAALRIQPAPQGGTLASITLPASGVDPSQRPALQPQVKG
jgi:signal transduction histidine kinase